MPVVVILLVYVVGLAVIMDAGVINLTQESGDLRLFLWHLALLVAEGPFPPGFLPRLNYSFYLVQDWSGVGFR